MKIQFLSFTCEDITVVMATLVSANRKRASQHLAIGVYIINRILHARLWIQILSSRVQLDISRVSTNLFIKQLRNHALRCISLSKYPHMLKNFSYTVIKLPTASLRKNISQWSTIWKYKFNAVVTKKK